MAPTGCGRVGGVVGLGGGADGVQLKTGRGNGDGNLAVDGHGGRLRR